LEHPLNPGVHLTFLDELATRDLVDSHLRLPFDAFVVGPEPRDGFLYQIASRAAGPFLLFLPAFSFLLAFVCRLPRSAPIADCSVTPLSRRLKYYSAVRLLTERRSPLRFRL
jgi:hypothetical protein